MELKSIIRVLPDQLANKIAAGEVVQRPASAVKELLENAIDAGAEEITLLIKKAGSELIQVIDDGSGMGVEDATQCFLRHATSKIQSVEDLERIHTLGFRGEALASIASVAQVELRTKRMNDASGVSVRIHGGEILSVEPCPTPNGTSIAVKNVFYNVPARRNFLKSPATEFKRIVEVFQFIALSHPQISFTFVHDEKEVYRLKAYRAGENGLLYRIGDLFQKNTEGMIPINDEAGYLQVQGYISKPSFTRKSRGEQYLFVNGRYIKNQKLDIAVSLGYGELLPKGSYPFYVIFLTLDPSHVDVNVHPTKTEVQFDDESGLFGFLRGAVRQALSTAPLIPKVGYGTNQKLIEHLSTDFSPTNRQKPENSRELKPTGKQSFPNHPISPSQATRQERTGLFPGNLGDISKTLYEGVSKGATNSVNNENLIVEKKTISSWQLHQKYILTETDEGLMLMDQHAAHERILYERFKDAMIKGEGSCQQLLFPQTIELSPNDFVLLEELLPDIKKMGFDIELLSGKTIVVSGIPSELQESNASLLIDELLEQYQTFENEKSLKGKENLAASLACRNAIKTGKKLSQDEISALYNQLFACEMPYACPHGRPTLIKISLDELDRRFGRIGHLEH